MFDKIRQLVFGSNNLVASRDINYYNPHPIRFYEKDIKEVIDCFSQEVVEIVGIVTECNDFYRPNIEEKNELNNLTHEYFEHIKSNSLIYFEKISEFLNDRRNEIFLSKYLTTARELNNKIVSNRTDFVYFDKIFDAVYSYIVEKDNYNICFDKELIWVFLHYMYWNCDIGVKYDKTS
ncbi:ABC-three component system protein [Bacillus horti]|uniref:ABC-three component systems C-terminal domain-containing protein n=1 Tax=Caldalkalibacillus horti TaxID=77523 RepID=A0ABT9VU08_9BACI|nr:ABC-three component system protein [Bacillus horti]MDQ0164473.1 hypothetical protein [Bacillus horti]